VRKDTWQGTSESSGLPASPVWAQSERQQGIESNVKNNFFMT
jgi:hypothetical protein